MTSLEVDGDGASAARRRRERRLRSWWRHECQSVRMALTTAAHHSAEKVAADVKNAGLRAQTMVSAGAWSGVLKDPAPQGAVTVGYVAAPVPFLSSPMLADAAAEAVDARTLKYLLKCALRRREEEEEERKEREMELAKENELQRGVTEALEKARLALEPSRGSKRKRKKRRRRRLPRSSVPRGGRARRRQRQWYVLAGFLGDGSPRAVFPSIVCGDSTGAVLGQGDMPVVVPSGASGQTVLKTAGSPQLQSIVGRHLPLRAANADPHGPVCTADHGDSTVAAYFGGRCSCWRVVQILRCCSEKPLSLPQLQLVEKSVTFSDPLYLTVICSVFAFEVQDSGLFWEMTSGCFPYSALFGSTLDTCTALWTCTMLVLLVTMSLALCSLLCLQAQDACLHGRPGAVLGQGFAHARCCATCGVLVQTVQYWRFRSCSSSRSLVLPCCYAEADPHDPGCSDDHLHSTVAAH